MARLPDNQVTTWDGGYLPELDEEAPAGLPERQAPQELPGRTGAFGLALSISASAVSVAAPAIAQADQIVAFDDDVNQRRVTPETHSASSGGALLTPGATDDAVVMTFAANQRRMEGFPDGNADIFKKHLQLIEDPNGAVNVIALTQAAEVPGVNNPALSEELCLEVDRGDGTQHTVARLDGSTHYLHVDGQPAWNVNGNCPAGFGDSGLYFHPGGTPGELMVTASFNLGDEMGTWNNSNVFPVSLHPQMPQDLACAIRDEIDQRGGMSVIDPTSSPRTENAYAGTSRLAATDTTIDRRNNLYANFMYARNADGSVSHLQRSADGTWTLQPDQRRGVPDELGTTVWSMIERTLPSGRVVTMVVNGFINPSTGEPSTQYRILEETAPNTFREVQTSLTEQHQDIDADGDGLPEFYADGTPGPDEASGRTDASQVRVGGVLVSQGADCADVGWPGRDPARVRTPFGRPCDSEIPGYNDAEVRDDGSALHKREAGEVEVFEDGAVGIPSGQKVLWVHTRDVHVAPEDSPPTPRFVTAPGNSVTLTAHSTRRPDGTEGGPITLSVLTFDNPFGAPTIVRVNAGETWQSDGPVVGVELVAAGTTFELEVGNENIPVPVLPPTPTPTPSTPPGSGTPAPSGTQVPEPTPEDSAEPTEEATSEPTGEATPAVETPPPSDGATPTPPDTTQRPDPSMKPTPRPTTVPTGSPKGDSGCDAVPGKKNPAAMILGFGAAIWSVVRRGRRKDGQ